MTSRIWTFLAQAALLNLCLCLPDLFWCWPPLIRPTCCCLGLFLGRKAREESVEIFGETVVVLVDDGSDELFGISVPPIEILTTPFEQVVGHVPNRIATCTVREVS